MFWKVSNWFLSGCKLRNKLGKTWWGNYFCYSTLGSDVGGTVLNDWLPSLWGHLLQQVSTGYQQARRSCHRGHMWQCLHANSDVSLSGFELTWTLLIPGKLISVLADSLSVACRDVNCGWGLHQSRASFIRELHIGWNSPNSFIVQQNPCLWQKC